MIWLLLLIFIPGGFSQIEGGKFKYRSMITCKSRVLLDGVTYQEESPNKQNQYNMSISSPNDTVRLLLIFDSEASLVLLQPDPKEVKVAFANLDVPRESFDFFIPEGSVLTVQVSGPSTGKVPCLHALYSESDEFCENPITGKYNKCVFIAEEENLEISSSQKSLDKTCGQRKVIHTELIVNGQSTKPGDWPWHVAIAKVTRYTEYFCGGTLLSKTVVLTAANCAFLRGNAVKANSMIVYLGKHHRVKGNMNVQEREVFEIILHPDFNAITSNNDIALLKLKSEVVFTDFVQPACLWQPDIKIPTEDLFGTVVGWGLNNQEELSSYLQRITIPMVSAVDCLESNPIFFQKALNTNNFCAGFANGTSACNADNGGGFMILVPDTPGDASQASGSWYVRGIVSLFPNKYETEICDPNHYTIFTDVDKYRDWLLKYLD